MRVTVKVAFDFDVNPLNDSLQRMPIDFLVEELVKHVNGAKYELHDFGKGITWHDMVIEKVIAEIEP